jgi:hypothetical protein
MRSDSHYAAVLAGSNASIEMHNLAAAAARDQLTAEQIQNAIERAVYRALRQTFADRLQVSLPEKMPNVWGGN